MNNLNLDDSKINNNKIWEYKVLHLTIENKVNNNSDPNIDSLKLKGALSPEFIKTQFPEQYKEKKGLSFPDQINNVLNVYGREGWELKGVENIAGFLLFFFIRKIIVSENIKDERPYTVRDKMIKYKELFEEGLINQQEWIAVKKKTLEI